MEESSKNATVVAIEQLKAPTQWFPLTRHLSYYLTPVLLSTTITPNQVTALSMLSGLTGAACFLAADHAWNIVGGLLLVMCYTLDNCDGEIARIKQMSSPWGAKFDDVVDWLVDASFFAMLGIGVSHGTGEQFWLWLGIAAAVGATIDYIIDLVMAARANEETGIDNREQQALDPKKPEALLDWLIYIFHKLSRADFCVIVLVLSILNIVWVLLPLGAIGAQVYWITDLFKRARGYHV